MNAGQIYRIRRMAIGVALQRHFFATIDHVRARFRPATGHGGAV
jgi:hypothetical protein